MRLADWEQRLCDFIEDNRARPFAWGEWDCILMATACAAELTGIDHAEPFRGQYSDRAGAANSLRTIGKGTLLKTIDAYFERKPVSNAQRGDLVWMAGSAGICVGAQALFVGEARLGKATGQTVGEGLIGFPRALLTKAWAV